MAKTAAKKKSEEKATEPVEPKMVEVVVTQAMLDADPSMAENGIALGDTIEMEEIELPETAAPEPEAPKTAAKVKGAMAVIKNGTEYVRTYAADQSAALAEFISKDASYTAVPDESIAAVEVPYEVKQKDGTINRTSKKFTNKAEAILFRNEHRSVCVVAVK